MILIRTISCFYWTRHTAQLPAAFRRVPRSEIKARAWAEDRRPPPSRLASLQVTKLPAAGRKFARPQPAVHRFDCISPCIHCTSSPASLSPANTVAVSVTAGVVVCTVRHDLQIADVA